MLRGLAWCGGACSAQWLGTRPCTRVATFDRFGAVSENAVNASFASVEVRHESAGSTPGRPQPELPAWERAHRGEGDVGLRVARRAAFAGRAITPASAHFGRRRAGFRFRPVGPAPGAADDASVVEVLPGGYGLGGAALAAWIAERWRTTRAHRRLWPPAWGATAGADARPATTGIRLRHERWHRRAVDRAKRGVLRRREGRGLCSRPARRRARFRAAQTTKEGPVDRVALHADRNRILTQSYAQSASGAPARRRGRGRRSR